MARPKQLYRTVLTIWSEHDPSDMELRDLARDADDGESFCSQSDTQLVTDSNEFPDTEFFDSDEEEE